MRYGDRSDIDSLIMYLRSSHSTSVLVIVPAWNEEAVLGQTLAELKDTSAEFDVLVVDDGSTDATARIAEDFGAYVCSLPFNLGVGGAMRLGYKIAVVHGYDVAVQFDADGQHDPSLIGQLVSTLRETDSNIVIGARFAGIGDYKVGWVRSVAMKILALSVSRIVGTQLTDSTSGFRAVDQKALRVFQRYYPAEYLGDTVEALVIANRNGCKITQVPCDMRPRLGGEASQSPGRAVVFLSRALLALFLALVRRWPVAK